MALPIPTSYRPMDAKLVGELPEVGEWQFEPKWDGFRCLAFKDGQSIDLRSKAGQPLGRYFPELVTTLVELKPKRFVLDGEIVVPVGDALSFDALLQRIHPAASRVKKLAAETPAMLVVFDLLCGERGEPLIDKPLGERREALEKMASAAFGKNDRIVLSPSTLDRRVAARWFAGVGGALDGIVAKRLDLPYQSGNRHGMVKLKKIRTADCVVGGFREASGSHEVGSLLLGLYDEAGRLNHVGFCSAFSAGERKKLLPKLTPLISPPGFTGNKPGGPSRWSTERSAQWIPLAPKLVVEVHYDHFTGNRFRHGTGFERWRPDKAPTQCLESQVVQESKSPLAFEGRRKKSPRKKVAPVS